jgi:hypothetical protein
MSLFCTNVQAGREFHAYSKLDSRYKETDAGIVDRGGLDHKQMRLADFLEKRAIKETGVFKTLTFYDEKCKSSKFNARHRSIIREIKRRERLGKEKFAREEILKVRRLQRSGKSVTFNMKKAFLFWLWYCHQIGKLGMFLRTLPPVNRLLSSYSL